MPPAASGPVFTVRRPILTGLGCAKAGAGINTAAAVPSRKLRRVTLTVMVSSWSSLASHLERGRLLAHRSADRHVPDVVPEPVDFREHDVVRLLDVDRIRHRHPDR